MSKKKTKSVTINGTWSIQHHVHGGFNLIETKHGFNKEKQKATKTERSYYYPNLELCAKKMVECGFDNDAETLMNVVCHMSQYTSDIVKALKEVEHETS